MIIVNSVSNFTLRNIPMVTFVPRRYKKKKEHWHDLQLKTFPTDKALAHFDDFYKSVFRSKWPSIRLALLCPQKYIALVNNFGDTEKTTETLKNLGAVDLNNMFHVLRQNFKEQTDASLREKQLKNIFEMDRMMETKVDHTKDKDLDNLVPEESKERIRGILDAADNPIIHTEELDRIVDPDVGSLDSSLNDFIPATKLKGMEDYIGEGEYYGYYKAAIDAPIRVQKEYDLNFPENLCTYSFERGNISRYPQPRKCSTGVFNYFLMDGSSLMPVLALDVKSGDSVLDMCAAPGGKSLTIFQTLNPRLLVCNDSSLRRVRRLQSVFNQFLYDYETKWKDVLYIIKSNAVEMDEFNFYNKILVDVPCTNDRLSLHERDNNIFKQSRIKERLRLPELQAELLIRALELLRVGGTCVYSTCSLSPVQNDGVVAMALRRLQDKGHTFTVKDMSPALTCLSDFFNFAKGMKYGHLVVPFLPSNFGPMYFSKIVKDS